MRSMATPKTTAPPANFAMIPEPVEATFRRLVRFSPEVIGELPDERMLRIDVNGCLAGTVIAVPDAPRELAVGWTFMHGFFDTSNELDCVTVDGDRVSVMVESGEDIDRRRLEAVGWADSEPLASPDLAETEPFQIEESALVDLIDATWQGFRGDGGTEGYLHVAIASTSEIFCIARDRTIDAAAAKVIGWALLAGKDADTNVLMVRGIVGRRPVEAAARIGVSLIVTSAIPTSEAFRAATGLSISVVGMAISRTMGLLVDSGHITCDMSV